MLFRSLCEILPNLEKENKNISINHEKIKERHFSDISLKMARFYRKIGMADKSNLLIENTLTSKSIVEQVKLLTLKREWELLENKGSEANNTLKRIVELYRKGFLKGTKGQPNLLKNLKLLRIHASKEIIQ